MPATPTPASPGPQWRAENVITIARRQVRHAALTTTRLRLGKTMLKTFALGLLGWAAATGASAQTFTDIPARQGNSTYLQDGRGTIVRSPFGLCWRTGTWTPTDAVPGCDGELVPPVAKPIAPEMPAAPVVQAPPPKACDFSITIGADEAFLFNKAALSATARKRIDEQVIAKLAACAKVDSILITGHADRLGSQQYNQRLSEKRAEAVAAYLKGKG
ncbi:OmpA family protein, partial [Oxalobacteraceae bacterium OM1]